MKVQGNTKPVVVVPVVWRVVVAVRRATVPCIVVPTTAAQNTIRIASSLLKYPIFA